jgi:hypothetical protein
MGVVKTSLDHEQGHSRQGEAEGITTDHIIEQILRDVPVTAEAVGV